MGGQLVGAGKGRGVPVELPVDLVGRPLQLVPLACFSKSSNSVVSVYRVVPVYSARWYRTEDHVPLANMPGEPRSIEPHDGQF